MVKRGGVTLTVPCRGWRGRPLPKKTPFQGGKAQEKSNSLTLGQIGGGKNLNNGMHHRGGIGEGPAKERRGGGQARNIHAGGGVRIKERDRQE